jgi:hypothetical protein
MAVVGLGYLLFGLSDEGLGFILEMAWLLNLADCLRENLF